MAFLWISPVDKTAWPASPPCSTRFSPTIRSSGSASATAAACDEPQEYRQLPFLTKHDLVADALAHPPSAPISPPAGAIHPLSPDERHDRLAVPRARYAADLGLVGPLLARCLREAGVTAGDRLFFAFSFAPSIGFWSAHPTRRRRARCAFPQEGLRRSSGCG